MPLQLSDGRNVFEALGQWYTLLALGAEPVDIEVLEDAARIEQVPLQVITDDAGDRRSEYGARLILVRPDQYVCWSGERSPDDPGAVMRAVAGAG